MSLPTLEKATAVDAGSDLASLVIAYHRENHHGDPDECLAPMCKVAGEVVGLDELFYGTDV